jgi:hypothetical protein
VAGWIAGGASWLAASTTLRSTTLRLAAIDDFVAADFQSFFSFVANATIAVSQSSRQSFDNFVVHAAAAVTTDLVTDFISGFVTNSLIAIVQSVDEGTHDFGIADTVVTIAQTIDRLRTVLGVASSLRFVDQLSDFAGLIRAATIVATAGFRATLWSTFRSALAVARSGTA